MPQREGEYCRVLTEAVRVSICLFGLVRNVSVKLYVLPYAILEIKDVYLKI